MPKPTILDELVYSCQANYDIPAMKGLSDLLANKKPSAIVWPQYKEEAPWPEIKISDKLIMGKAQCFCLCLEKPVWPRESVPAMAIESQPKYKELFIDRKWEIRGILTEVVAPSTLSILPLLQSVETFAGDHSIFPDVPVRISFKDGAIILQTVDTEHLVYTQFYGRGFDLFTEEEKNTFKDRALFRGCNCLGCLSDFSHYIDGIPGGMFKIVKPKAPRIKYKNGKIKKIYELGKLGYFEYVDKIGE